MSRSSVLIIVAGSFCLIVSVAATVRFVVAPHDAHRVATKAPPIAQSFDTTSGQVMQPRWNKREGEGNGASQN